MLTRTRKMKQSDKLYSLISQEVGSSTLDLINEYVELQLELEQECIKIVLK